MVLFCYSPIPSSLQPGNQFARTLPFLSKPLFPRRANFNLSRTSFPTPYSPPNSLFVRSPHCCGNAASAETSNSRSESNIIFVKGLAQSTSEERLKALFLRIGDVSRVKIITDKKTKLPVGFAYVWFSSEEFAEKAVKEMNGEFFDGKFITVTMARPGSCQPRAKTPPYKF